MSETVQKQASDLFNALTFEDRMNKAGLGYSLAQLTTIIQLRESNKEMVKREDRRLAAWQKNIENTIVKEFLS